MIGEAAEEYYSKIGFPENEASMVRRWLHELEPVNHLKNLGHPDHLRTIPTNPKPENIRCRRNTGRPTPPAYAYSIMVANKDTISIVDKKIGPLPTKNSPAHSILQAPNNAACKYE